MELMENTFLMYMVANDKMRETEDRKIATFLWLICSKAVDIYNTLFPNDGTMDSILRNQNEVAENAAEDQNGNADAAGKQGQPNVNARQVQGRTLDVVLAAFDNYCLPRKNITMETFKFNTIIQKEKQSFADFEMELCKQSQYCEFVCTCGNSYENRMLRDRIILGVHDKKLQLKLLDGGNEPLNQVIETCKVYEAANANKLLLDHQVNSNINVVSRKDNLGSTATIAENKIGAVKRTCYNCGELFSASHLRTCKANNVTCNQCGKNGHFTSFCKKKKRKQLKNNQHSVGQQRKWNKSGNNNKNVQSQLI